MSKILIDLYNIEEGYYSNLNLKHVPDEDALFELMHKETGLTRKEFNNWCSSKRFIDFVRDWIFMKNIVDLIVDKKKISQGSLNWINDLGNSLHPKLSHKPSATVADIFRASKRNLFDLDEIEVQQFKLLSEKSQIIHIYSLVYQELKELILQKREIKRCEVNDCENIFYTEEELKVYCSRQCCNSNV